MARMFRNLGAGLLRGATADVLGMPVDTLNMIRQGLLAPAEGGNPMARSLTGLLGPVQETGSSDYFAQQMGLPQGEGPAYEMARMVSPSPTDIMSAVRRAPTMQELITYHGTPHRFEPTPANPLGEFEAAKIGTGEGAQAYGHGIYLAESPEVAAGYRASVSPKAGEQFGLPDGPIKGIATMIAAKGDEGEKAAREVWASSVDDIDEAVRMAKEAIAGKSSLYTADLPDKMIDRMLDWDKALSEQPKAVKKIIKKHRPGLFSAGRYPDTLTAGSNFSARGIKIGPDSVKNYNPVYLYGVPADSMTGQDYWHLIMRDQQANPEAASKAIKDLGIPGIKYFDGISRSKGEGTRNFVVFPGEEKKVKILKRE